MISTSEIDSRIVVSVSEKDSKGRELKIVVTGKPKNLALSISGTIGQGSILLSYNDIELLRKLLTEVEPFVEEAIYNYNEGYWHVNN